MRTAPGVSRTAVLLVAGVVAGCVTASPRGGSASGYPPGFDLLSAAEQRQVADSISAERIAEQVGPRVRVRANFENEGGDRRIQATVHADDDAYILVGQIDAGGRLSVVYPAHPTDDGFVRGGHSYIIPSFFGGFADEYRYRRATDYTRLMASRARDDSYDAGTGYVFVIASWRPLQVERVADGSRWTSYRLSDQQYLSDPREAVDELAQVVAGDSREAYTIEYAHYLSTNYGTYAANAYDQCSFATYGTGYGFNTLGMSYSPFYSGIGLGGLGFGLGSYYASMGAFGMPIANLFSPFGYSQRYDALTGCSYYVPTYRPYIVATWPIQRQPLPGLLRPITPGLPHPPRIGGVPLITGPGLAPAATQRPTIADLKATDVNGMHPAGPATHPSIEQMVKHRRPGLETMTQPGTDPFVTAPTVQRERPRFAPPSEASPHVEPTSTRARPRFEPAPPPQQHFTPPPRYNPPPRMAPAPHFEPPPMHVEPMHAAPSSSGSSSGGHKGKP